MEPALLIAILIIGAALILAYLSRRSAAAGAAGELRETVVARVQALEQSLANQLTTATADMAARIEQSRGDLRQELSDRVSRGFVEVMTSLNHNLDTLSTRQADNLERIRQEVDQKLGAITERVQEKLDQNIRAGFAQFEKVQHHLQEAEAQLRNIDALGSSIRDLNSLLKLPHLRGRFGEASMERLLADFLPPQMYEIQSAPGGEGGERADAVIKFPEARLPIDAKFPREQILPLFEPSDELHLAAARKEFARVIKEQARRIEAYIQPQNGTTDMALMYLPSETLYFEIVLNGELSEFLNSRRIFPVSPNTLIVTLQAISMVQSWYQVAQGFRKTREELAKARRSFELFQGKFDAIGKSLERAQEAYGVAAGHLTRYRVRVAGITGEEAEAIESSGTEEPAPPGEDDSAP